jgi:hypothetical protein
VQQGHPDRGRIAQYQQGLRGRGGVVFRRGRALSVATGAPITTSWFAWKLFMFGLIFWVILGFDTVFILGFDTVFEPFTTILRIGPGNTTPADEAKITRMTRLTMAWSVLLPARKRNLITKGRDLINLKSPSAETPE